MPKRKLVMSVRAIKRRVYYHENRSKIVRWNRKWREKNLKKMKLRERVRRKRYYDNSKTPRGRVCRSCLGTDRELFWCHWDETLCATCQKRSEHNGFCRTCGAARYRKRYADGRKCHKRPCRCAGPASAKIRRLWEALRWEHSASELTFGQLARLMRRHKRTVERQKMLILETFRRFDPEAEIENLGNKGLECVFHFSNRKVRAGLERIVTEIPRPKWAG